MHRTFHATASAAAIGKVTRLFAGTWTDIANEAFQNARRAGATRIVVAEAIGADGQASITLTDDGCGIADPAIVLTLGESDWDAALCAREDPAGMGFFSLANRSVRLASSVAPGTGWSLAIASREQWEGRVGVEVVPAELAPGTRLGIDCRADEFPAVQRACQEAARYFPLPVVYAPHGRGAETLARATFGGDAVHEEQHDGIVYRVVRRNGDGGRGINFHGVVVRHRLTSVGQVHGEALTVALDIVDGNALRLVLPARKEVVEDDGLARVLRTARAVIFRAIAAQGDHSLAFADWQAARSLGVDLPPAAARLSPWRPRLANSDDEWIERAVDVGERSLVMAVSETGLDQSLKRAIDRAGLDHDLREAEPAFAGYDWYDALDRLHAVELTVATDGGTQARDALDDLDGVVDRPDAMRLGLTIAGPGASTRLDLPADVFIEHHDDMNEMRTLVARDADIAVGVLADLIYDAGYRFDDDAGLDSSSTQSERARADALEKAAALLLSDDEATAHGIRAEIEANALWRLPHGQDAVIRIENRQVTVAITGERERPLAA